MGYDCSITERRYCNYCTRGKQVPFLGGADEAYISETDALLRVYKGEEIITIGVNFCPVCGKKLKEPYKR